MMFGIIRMPADLAARPDEPFEDREMQKAPVVGGGLSLGLACVCRSQRVGHFFVRDPVYGRELYRTRADRLGRNGTILVQQPAVERVWDLCGPDPSRGHSPQRRSIA